MGYNSENGGKAIVACALTQLDKPYSESGPPGSFFNGQDWVPGCSDPTYFDCDGFVYFCCRKGAGIVISNGLAETQWQQRLGGVVPDSEPLKPGDICAFWGATGGPGNAGHTGIVYTYDAATRTGLLINAYDSARGVCIIPFLRFQRDNGNNGLGWIGAYRPANTLPDPPKPPPLPAPKGAPTAADIKKAKLVPMTSSGMAQIAVNNGWTLWYWSEGHNPPFCPQVNGEPRGPALFATVDYKTKRKTS